MKRVLLTIALVATVFTSCKKDATSKIKAENVAQAAVRDEAAKKLPVIEFEKKEHDFGTIQRGTAVETVFKFTNTGNAPLIITNASSSCGCTVPEFHKDEPIAPGETGELVVKYNGSGINQVSKTVTVTTNTEKGSELVKIKAFVEEPGK
ncbi:DUF1573 domain-containing protein [Sinomicrobium weinanense]|uniref:DUF1573 domain-containing protein n=1 Tax=Sinomicrobium weinanense TaxID=2842200 RepID=A0A926Q250_9FLAO|nr:DUF1573 domain-containing protein [Sinomicrobium weinanense]MBC9795474.1 DUF1573 domain-containing protein [Sinomicrobium weinanense]MBU3123379.1 DUF1573 domain-containing protein [Sinomicrobium weinanense]